MNKNLLHSLAILALAFLAGKCELLTAQSGDVNRGGTELPGLHHGLALANSLATSSQIPESDRDPGAIGLAKTKGYEFRSIDYPGEDLSLVYDFNGKTAVGSAGGEAFTYKGSSYALLNVPGAEASGAVGINTSGKIVGYYRDSSGHVHGFLYDGSRYTTIDYPGSASTYAWDINDAGLIVGQYTDSNSVNHAFLYDNGTFTAINFPGADDTYAYGINSSGEIVGSYDYSLGSNGHGFLLSNGVYSSLDGPLANATFAQGINDAGTIAGYYDANFIPHGFTYAGGAFTTVDVTGAGATELWRIKNSGNVVGIVVDSLGEYHGIIGK
jgi:probable HAF family extracellular repeat protein